MKVLYLNIFICLFIRNLAKWKSALNLAKLKINYIMGGLMNVFYWDEFGRWVTSGVILLNPEDCYDFYGVFIEHV